MRGSDEPMTVQQLKRSMDARFAKVDAEFLNLRREFRDSEERLKRHMSVVVESIHDDMRMFAEAIGVHSDRLGDHEKRLRRLERR